MSGCAELMMVSALAVLIEKDFRFLVRREEMCHSRERNHAWFKADLQKIRKDQNRIKTSSNLSKHQDEVRHLIPLARSIKRYTTIMN